MSEINTMTRLIGNGMTKRDISKVIKSTVPFFARIHQFYIGQVTINTEEPHDLTEYAEKLRVNLGARDCYCTGLWATITWAA